MKRLPYTDDSVQEVELVRLDKHNKQLQRAIDGKTHASIIRYTDKLHKITKTKSYSQISMITQAYENLKGLCYRGDASPAGVFKLV